MHFYVKFMDLRMKAGCLEHGLEVLLIAIARANATGLGLIRCTDLIVMQDLGSPATIHKNYQTLLSRGYLELRGHETDKRIKYIYLSDKGNAYMKGIEVMARKCLRGLMIR